MTEDKFKEIEDIYKKGYSLQIHIKNCQNRIQKYILKLKDENISVCDKRDYESALKMDSERIIKYREEFNKL
jgi:hypothetical protein